MSQKTIQGVQAKTDARNNPYRIVTFTDGNQASTWEKNDFKYLEEGNEVEISVMKKGQYFNISSVKLLRKGASSGGGGGRQSDLTKALGQAWGNSVTNAMTYVLASSEAPSLESVFEVAMKLFSKSCEMQAIAIKNPMSFIEMEDEPGPELPDDAQELDDFPTDTPKEGEDDLPF